MRRLLKATLILALWAALPCAKANDIVLCGNQKAGSGHAVNAKHECPKVELTTAAKIIKVEGTATRYTIWLAPSPENPSGRPFLSGSKKSSIVGKTLPAGTYTVLPGLDKGQETASVSITLRPDAK